MVRPSLVGVAILVAALFLASEVLASIASRYDAFISICGARRAAGIQTDEEAHLCREIVDARRNRENQRLEILLSRAARLFTLRSAESAGWEITIGPRLEVAGVEGESRAARISLLGEDAEFTALNDAEADDMKIYELLRSADSLVYLASVHRETWHPEARGMVPPPGWTEQSALTDRWEKLAITAGSRVRVTGPGIRVDHPGLAEWLRAETRSRPRRAIHLTGNHLMRLDSFFPLADTWILRMTASERPDGTRGISIVDAVWMLVNMHSNEAAVVVPTSTPWFEVVQDSLEGLGYDALGINPRDRGIAGIAAPGLILLVNPSIQPRRVNLRPTTDPGATAELDSSLEASLTILDDDGTSVETVTRRDPALIRFELPPRSLGFVHLARRDSAE